MTPTKKLESLNIRFIDCCSTETVLFSVLDILEAHKISESLWVVRDIHPRHLVDRSPDVTDLNYLFITEHGARILMDRLAFVCLKDPEVAAKATKVRVAIEDLCDEWSEDFAGSYRPKIHPLQAKFWGLV
jgi:hypothetical protein